MLRQLGIDYFIDYAEKNVTNQDITYDIIFNLVANSRYSYFIKLLNTNGRYLMGNAKLIDMLRSVLTSKITDKKAIFSFDGEQIEELVALRTMIEAVAHIIEYIEFYNKERLHSSIDYQSPENYEKLCA